MFPKLPELLLLVCLELCVFNGNWIKKGEGEGKKCHAKTMKSKKSHAKTMKSKKR